MTHSINRLAASVLSKNLNQLDQAGPPGIKSPADGAIGESNLKWTVDHSNATVAVKLASLVALSDYNEFASANQNGNNALIGAGDLAAMKELVNVSRDPWSPTPQTADQALKLAAGVLEAYPNSFAIMDGILNSGRKDGQISDADLREGLRLNPQLPDEVKLAITVILSGANCERLAKADPSGPYAALIDVKDLKAMFEPYHPIPFTPPYIPHTPIPPHVVPHVPIGPIRPTEFTGTPTVQKFAAAAGVRVTGAFVGVSYAGRETANISGMPKAVAGDSKWASLKKYASDNPGGQWSIHANSQYNNVFFRYVPPTGPMKETANIEG